MRIHTQFPVAQMVGSVNNSGLVFFKRNDNNFARANTKPSDPQSVEQVKMRAYMSAASKNWSLLTQAQRNDWQAYADSNFTKDDAGFTVTPSGIATYIRANSIRQVLGLALTSAAPTGCTSCSAYGSAGGLGCVAGGPGAYPDALLLGAYRVERNRAGYAGDAYACDQAECERSAVCAGGKPWQCPGPGRERIGCDV